MLKKKITAQRGFTITEVAIVLLLVVIICVGIGVVVFDAQRGWSRTYERINSDIVIDGYVARKTFDRVIRQASQEMFLVSDGGDWIEVYCYADGNSPVVDRYARFYDDGDGQLNVEYGTLDPRETLDIHTVCENVSSCVFKGAGRSAQMILTLDNGSQTVSVVSSPVLHNP